MKAGIILFAFGLLSRAAQAQASPNQTASDFFAAVIRRDWPAAARLIDLTDGSLRSSALKNLYGWLETVRARGDSLLRPDGSFGWSYSDPPGGWSDSLLTRAYGTRRDLGLPRDLSVAELVSLSPAQLTELLLEVSLARYGPRPWTLLGVIVEADTIAHALYRRQSGLRFLSEYWNTEVMHLRFAPNGWAIVASPQFISAGTLGQAAMNAWRLARMRPTPIAPNQPGIRVSTQVRTFQVTDAKLEDFVPAVPAQDSGGACSTRAPAVVVQRERWLTYIFGPETRPTRRVLVGLDSSGNLVRYNDMRGSAVQGPEPDSLAGPGTSISFTTYDPGIFAFNLNTPVMAGRFRLFGMTALTAKNLGEIGKLVERVKRECDSSRKG